MNVMALPIKNKIDLTSYVALGDSITAGYTDGALCYYGQQCSYPLLIAGQMKLIGGGDFKQPLIDKNSVGVGFFGNSCLVLNNVMEDIEPTSLHLSYISPEGDKNAFILNTYHAQGPFHNMGVPGAKTISLVTQKYGNSFNGDGNYNPFFTRMASNPSKASILSDALALKPTFFTLFIGNNDALAYALSGGTTNSITPLFGAPGLGFEESVRAVIDALIKNGAKGVIANLPDLKEIPFFTAIPYNGLMVNEQNLPALNEKYNRSGIHFSLGLNPFIIESDDSYRLMKKGELVLLDILLDRDKLSYLKGLMPIPKKYILTYPEIINTQKAIVSYNECLETIANEKKLAFVNVNSFMKNARRDRIYNPYRYNFNYKSGGVFSLDGLHPNAFGQALLANEFIKEINNTYDVAIPFLDSNKFKDIVFP